MDEKKFRIGVCGLSKGRAIAQAKMIAWEIKNSGIKSVEILPVVFRESGYMGIKPDKIIIDDLKVIRKENNDFR